MSNDRRFLALTVPKVAEKVIYWVDLHTSRETEPIKTLQLFLYFFREKYGEIVSIEIDQFNFQRRFRLQRHQQQGRPKF